MALWKKKVNGWPPDDPPKGSETFEDKEKKAFQDSSNLYNAMIMQDKLMGYGSKKVNDNIRWNTNLLKDRRIKKKVDGIENPIAEDYQNEEDQFKNGFTQWTARIEDKKLINYYKSLGFNDNNIMYHSSPDIVSDKISAIGSYFDGTAVSPIYKKPTGNGLTPQLSKIPIIKQEQTSSLIKFRPPTPLPEGNVELQNTGYTTVGVRKKPDGTRFIYDRSGKTDKTVIIDDNRIGFEHYIKKLYE